MGKRNITDEEIGLIKAMLKRGMRNDEAHFHFNRQDRLISPGRIAQIKSGKYGGDVAIANYTALDQFLADSQQRSGAPAKAARRSGPDCRQQALACAAVMSHGPCRPNDLREVAPRAPAILLENVYGWFERVERGIYRLTEAGEQALVQWKVSGASVQAEEPAETYSSAAG